MALALFDLDDTLIVGNCETTVTTVNGYPASMTLSMV